MHLTAIPAKTHPNVGGDCVNETVPPHKTKNIDNLRIRYR